MNKKDKDKKLSENTLSFRLTKKEYAFIKEQAEKLGIPVSQLLTQIFRASSFGVMFSDEPNTEEAKTLETGDELLNNSKQEKVKKQSKIQIRGTNENKKINSKFPTIEEFNDRIKNIKEEFFWLHVEFKAVVVELTAEKE